MASREEWGNITWYLFHGLAEKIKEDKFMENKNLLIKILKSVCQNLPCPDCSEHATKMLNNLNYEGIKNKEDFKKFIFKFHNIINTKLNKKLFTEEELVKYKTINMSIIFNYFFKIYSIGNRSEKMMMFTAFKNVFISNLKRYFRLIAPNLEK